MLAKKPPMLVRVAIANSERWAPRVRANRKRADRLGLDGEGRYLPVSSPGDI